MELTDWQLDLMQKGTEQLMEKLKKCTRLLEKKVAGCHVSLPAVYNVYIIVLHVCKRRLYCIPSPLMTVGTRKKHGMELFKVSKVRFKFLEEDFSCLLLHISIFKDTTE